MKEIKAYECSDGTVKHTKLDALIRERTLALRGIMQSNRAGRNGDGALTPTQAANEIVNNFDEIRKIVDNFNRRIRATQQAQQARTLK